MADKKTAYAPKAVVNLDDEAIKFQGQMTKAIQAHRYEPLLILMNLGSKAVISVPAGMALPDKLAPN